MTEKNDIFAGIAAGGIDVRKNGLEETLPLPLPDVLFTEDEIEYIPEPEIPHEEKLKQFNDGIENLRNRYAPFMKRQCSEFPVVRARITIDCFSFRFDDEKEEIAVKIPHYTGPAGRWKAVYTTEFRCPKLSQGEKAFLVFKGVDYIAEVYLNGIFIGNHEGFFAAFEFDVSEGIREENKLEVFVKNDIPTIGNGDMQVNGDKLYAATGPGWDDPADGWHHCPAGGGIFDKVYIESRPVSYIDDVFIRPDVNNSKAYVTVSYFSEPAENGYTDIELEVHPYNFKGKSYTISSRRKCGHGLNYYDFEIPMEGCRTWEPEEPFLYLLWTVSGDDGLEKTFGMRSFVMDEASEPKGTLYLNNRPVLLRGANEMGHLQLCVMNDDFEQLTEDILIAKYCNMNYYRITQRPVQEEIYHYCDMLGMMCQTDLPLFGYMRKNKFHEGIKQAGEMERHIRNHPSVIMSTYINEPFAPSKYGLLHRHLSRPELELFFDACDAATLFENPDRVIKRVEGDYDPPTEKGMSDFHCYNMWYTNHALPIGMLYKGYLPALKKGWKTGCGEYGTEGLDNHGVMKKYYPPEWLPASDDESWIPDRIVKSQTNTMHGDWYEEQDHILDWIDAGQEHQAFATKLMTLAFRRRSDKIVSTAVHLLIDAWPSGWMKTLLDVDRVPKKAFFSFRESLQPLKVNLRCDRWTAYGNETLPIEAWILNDTPKGFENMTLNVTVSCNGEPDSGYSLKKIAADPCTSFIAGAINTKMPVVAKRTHVHVGICLSDDSGILSTDSMIISVFPERTGKIGVFCLGDKARQLALDTPGLYPAEPTEARAMVVSSPYAYNDIKDSIDSSVRVMFLKPDEGEAYYEAGSVRYEYKPIFDPGEVGEDGDIKGLSFVALSDGMKKYFDGKDCSYWFNGEKEFIDHVAEFYIDTEPDLLHAFGYEKPHFGKSTSGRKRRLPVACEKDGKVFLSFETKGRAGFNPVLDEMIYMLLTETTV